MPIFPPDRSPPSPQALPAWLAEREYAFGAALADLDGDREAYQELADLFYELLPGELERLRSPGLTRDRLVALMHEAANTLGVIGARLYSQRIREAERLILSGAEAGLAPLAEATAVAMERTGVALRDWLAGRPG